MIITIIMKMKLKEIFDRYFLFNWLTLFLFDRHFAVAWIAVMLTELHYLIRLFLELPPTSLKHPFKVIVIGQLFVLLTIHIFVTEGSQNLRKQFAATVQLISIGNFTLS